MEGDEQALSTHVWRYGSNIVAICTTPQAESSRGDGFRFFPFRSRHRAAEVAGFSWADMLAIVDYVPVWPRDGVEVVPPSDCVGVAK
jgi:hypothetical protein